MEVPAQERPCVRRGPRDRLAGNADAPAPPNSWKSPPRNVPVCVKAPAPTAPATQMLPLLATTAPGPWKAPPRIVPVCVKAPTPSPPATQMLPSLAITATTPWKSQPQKVPVCVQAPATARRQRRHHHVPNSMEVPAPERPSVCEAPTPNPPATHMPPRLPPRPPKNTARGRRRCSRCMPP